MSEIKVGDRVRTLPDRMSSYDGKIVEFTVTEIKSHGMSSTEYAVGDPENYGVYLRHLELVTPEPELSFDAYDPSMLPMLAKLVDLAERESWCPEFDKALAEIGAPDRAEIKRLTTPEPEMPLGIYCAKVFADNPQSSILWRHNAVGWWALDSRQYGAPAFHDDHPRAHFSYKREPWWEQITLLTAVES